MEFLTYFSPGFSCCSPKLRSSRNITRVWCPKRFKRFSRFIGDFGYVCKLILSCIVARQKVLFRWYRTWYISCMESKRVGIRPLRGDMHREGPPRRPRLLLAPVSYPEIYVRVYMRLVIADLISRVLSASRMVDRPFQNWVSLWRASKFADGTLFLSKNSFKIQWEKNYPFHSFAPVNLWNFS